MAEFNIDWTEATVGLAIAVLLALAAVRWAEETVEDATGGLIDV